MQNQVYNIVGVFVFVITFKSMKDFLKSFEDIDCKIEFISIDKDKLVKTITNYESRAENIYFSYWIKKDSTTRGRKDILKKRWFIIDLDIRKNYKEIYWEDMTDFEIIDFWENIAKNLHLEDEFLGEWSYIIFSGNWLQIHWLGDWQEFNIEDYQIGVKAIYSKWNNFWWEDLYKADPQCADIARIMRLPNTINQKNWSETKIIARQDKNSRLVNNIKRYAEIENKKLEKIRLEKEQEFIKKTFTNNDKNIYNEINNIPAYIIAQKIVPIYILNRNWKNFDNKVSWFTAYYYDKEKNVIYNWWSKHFNYWKICLNNFSMVKHEYNFTNLETFNYFKDLLKK